MRLVGDLAPDLLCLDLTAEQWQRRDFGGLPREYRAALLPLAEQTDIVVVPLAAARPPAEPAATGPRGGAIRALRRLLVWLQRQSPGAAAADGGARHWLADLLYVGIAALAGRASRRA